MANWGVTGGIGAGIMQGLQFMRQREGDARQEQALANQTELLGMKKQIHGEKMGELNRANAEVQRAETLDTLKGSIEANYQDRPDYERAEMFRKYGAEMGLFKPADLDVAVKVRDGLVQVAGPDAYRALIDGNISPMQRVLATKGYDIKADTKGGNYLVRMPGSESHVPMSIQGIGQINEMATWRDQENAKAKTALDRRKTEAEIQEKIAIANLKDRLPQDRIAGGRGGAGGKAGKEPVGPAAMFGADAYLERFGVGKDSDPATRARGDDGYGYYMRLHKSNPGTFNSVDGNEMAFRLSRDLMNGTVKRDTKFDPKTMSWNRYVTDTQGGRYNLDPYGIDPRQLKDPEGKPAIDPAVIEQEEVSALKIFSTSNPTQYGTAAKLAQAKDLTTEELMAAAEGKPITSGGRSATLSPAMANVALMIRRRGMEQAKPRISTPGGIGRKQLPDTSGYGAGGAKGTSLAGEAFDNYIADPVAGFFKDSAAKARAE